MVFALTKLAYTDGEIQNLCPFIWRIAQNVYTDFQKAKKYNDTFYHGSEITIHQNTSEGAILQRLFLARQRVKSEVEETTENYNKPLALDKIDYVIWGNGNPAWSDPRTVCTRMFSVPEKSQTS